MVKNLTHENYYDEVTESDTPVIIDFYADWCAPCQMMKPVFEEVSKDFKGKLKFLKLDTMQEGVLASRFGVQGIPAFVILKDEKEIGRIVGYMPEEVFKQKIAEVLN